MSLNEHFGHFFEPSYPEVLEKSAPNTKAYQYIYIIVAVKKKCGKMRTAILLKKGASWVFKMIPSGLTPIREESKVC